MADFYVIQDEKTGLFYDGRFGCTTDALRDTLARFVSVENATKDIKANRRRGRDVSNWQIVGINMVVDGVIKPDLGVSKVGYAIECTVTGEHRGQCYWRGNRKTPKVTVSNLLHGPLSPATASIFDTEPAAWAAVEILRKELLALQKATPKDCSLFDIYKRAKFNVARVGE